MLNLLKLVVGIVLGVLGFFYFVSYLLMFFSNMGFSTFLSGATIGVGMFLLAYVVFYFINLKKVEPEFDLEVETKFTILGNGQEGEEPEIIPDHDFGHEPKMKDITPETHKGSKTIH